MPTLRAILGLTLGGVFATLACSGHALSEEVGTLRMQFVYDGPPPKMAAGGAPAAADCGVPLVLAPLVHPKNGGVANVVVWLDAKASNKPLPAEALRAPATPVTVANAACVFEPHVAVVRTGQPLIFTNADPSPHNVTGEPRDCEPFNPLIPPNGQFKTKIVVAQNLPVPISCSIHPFMHAYLVVQDHPYVGVSDSDGRLSIGNLPPGEWTFVVWHEQRGFVTDPQVAGKTQNWKRGRLIADIRAGNNDFPTVAWAF